MSSLDLPERDGAASGHVLTTRPDGTAGLQRDVRLTWTDGRIDELASGSGDLLLIPGLVDAHIHLPQYRVRGRFSQALLP